jgi:hypothetical protein
LAIKNLVKIKDYLLFLLQESTFWSNTKTKLLKQRDSVIENSKEIQEVERKYFLGFSRKEQKLRQTVETEEIKDLNYKLDLINQHLKTLEAEWNRTEYYTLLQFEMIEADPSLADLFFKHTIQEMKFAITYQ